MPRSSICVMDLPELQIILFLHGNGLARLQASPRWHINGLTRADSVLAYGHRGWPTGQPMLARDIHQVGQGDIQRGRVRTEREGIKVATVDKTSDYFVSSFCRAQHNTADAKRGFVIAKMSVTRRHLKRYVMGP